LEISDNFGAFLRYLEQAPEMTIELDNRSILESKNWSIHMSWYRSTAKRAESQPEQISKQEKSHPSDWVFSTLTRKYILASLIQRASPAYQLVLLSTGVNLMAVVHLELHSGVRRLQIFHYTRKPLLERSWPLVVVWIFFPVRFHFYVGSWFPRVITQREKMYPIPPLDLHWELFSCETG